MAVLQVIPRQLCDNAGFDATDVLNKLRQKHALPSGWLPFLPYACFLCTYVLHNFLYAYLVFLYEIAVLISVVGQLCAW